MVEHRVRNSLTKLHVKSTASELANTQHYQNLTEANRCTEDRQDEDQ